MKRTVSFLLAGLAFAGLASTTLAGDPQELAVSIGVRETAQGGAPDVGIGGTGSNSAGGIEWINKDGQNLILDGTWQTFTWNLASANADGRVSAFAGATANGILEGAYGVLEHLRLRNTGQYDGTITLWIDLVQNAIDPAGPPPPATTTIQDFEGFAANTEVMFQEPRFSGSTAGDLDLLPNAGGVDNTVGFSGTSSGRYQFSYLVPDPTPADSWLRLTTFSNGQPTGSPQIQFDQSSVVTMRIMGIPEPSTLLLLGVPALVAAARRRRA